MSNAAFLTRAVVKNYKSIAACDVDLRPLTLLVGPNGAGKSNFLDALRFVADGLRTSLDHAFRERGGIGEVRRRSGGHPNHFGARVEFALPNGSAGSYGFRIGAKPNGFEVLSEECVLRPPEALAGESRFTVAAGEVSSTVPGPAAASDRLYLVSASGLPEFRPVYDSLSNMGFYNLSTERIRDLQAPDAGELLARDGGNLAAVLDLIGKRRPELKARIEDYLAKVAPGIQGVDAIALGPRETLQFRQEAAGGDAPWRFLAANMSDGTLRALGVLVALFQTGPAPLVGLEEPEAGLHPAAVSVLLDAMFAAGETRQVLVTSHSPDLLDSARLETDSILAVIAEAGSTYVGPLDAVGREALRKRLCTAGELLRLDQLRPERGKAESSSSQLRLLGENSPDSAPPEPGDE
ncbi:MAG: AAA family ATPase [Bryobacteraceae bacterium]|jgi:predicted ATPase